MDNWDTYISTLNSLGLEEAVAEAQEVYNAQAEKLQAYQDNKTNQG